MVMRTYSITYFPDDLPHPKSPSTVVRHFEQCGCTLNEPSQETHLPYAYYGDVISYIPSSPPKATNSLFKEGSPFGGSPSPARSVSPPITESEPEEVHRIVDPGFCERSSCVRSNIFNKEWNRLWEAHNSEMKEALEQSDMTGGKAFEEFKAKIRREAQQVTEHLLRSGTQ